MNIDFAFATAQSNKLFCQAFRHPSQVTTRLSPFLEQPHEQLVDLPESEKRKLQSKFRKFEKNASCHLPSSREIHGQDGFMLRPAELEAIEISESKNFFLDLGELKLEFESARREKFAITLRGCENFVVRGGSFVNPRNLIMIEDCEEFSIQKVCVSASEGYGIIIFNSRDFEVRDCVHVDSLASGLYCLGATTHGWIHNNIYQGGTGYFNWDAGIHINHCSPDLTLADIPERSHEDKRIVEKTLKPSLLFFENNHTFRNQAQGIYCEGAMLCAFEGNTLSHNNKEGICFDWGSAGNIFRRNTVIQNGQRANLSDAMIKADFIERFPILPDGSSSCKLPGVSIDNGAVNVLIGNKIHQNFGGGLKMVRTGISNLVVGNAIIDNAVGRNEVFRVFNGVSFLGMGTKDGEFDQTNANLDFYPSEHNLCVNNTFRVDARDEVAMHDSTSPNNAVYDNLLIQ